MMMMTPARARVVACCRAARLAHLAHGVLQRAPDLHALLAFTHFLTHGSRDGQVLREQPQTRVA